MQDDSRYSAPALDKGLDILDVLSFQEKGLTQIEIARALNRSVSEIFRMLVVLRRRGLVDLDSGGDRYFLTTRLFEMASRTPVIARLTVAAVPIMQRLANLTDQSVHLAICADDNILVVGQVDNPGDNVVRVRLGARIPIWRTNSGRVMLANRARADFETFVLLFPHPDGLSAERLSEEFAAVRERGFDVSPSLVIKGVINISAPIVGQDGSAVAALTIPYVERHFGGTPIDTCLKELVTAAGTISQAIGGKVGD